MTVPRRRGLPRISKLAGRAKPPPAMTVGLAVRSAAMDCEASEPIAALLVWFGRDGRIHKVVLPCGVLFEDGLACALERLPPGSTPAARVPRA